MVESIDELLDKDLKDFQLIWYEMNNNEKYNNEILYLLKKFIEERENLLSTKFKIVVIKTDK